MLVGFSTGALTRGDFLAALDMLASRRLDAVEISALRLQELPALVEALPALDLRPYKHVSVHAPSKFDPSEEARLVATLAAIAHRVHGIVVHAEALHDVRRWRALGTKVLIENADIRKRVGRTAAEMSRILEELPEARVCFDLAHVHQIDFSLVEARRMLRAFGDRIGQIHISQLDNACHHEALTHAVGDQFRKIASLLPETAVIIESCVPAAAIDSQVELVRACMRPPPAVAA